MQGRAEGPVDSRFRWIQLQFSLLGRQRRNQGKQGRYENRQAPYTKTWLFSIHFLLIGVIN
jgi:hypothetical protein